MRNLLLVEHNGGGPVAASALSLEEYKVRKISDFYSLPAHINEFNPDAIIIDLSEITDSSAGELCGLTGMITVPVMVFAGKCSSHLTIRLIQADISYLSVSGLPDAPIKSLLEVASARFSRLQTLKSALEEARTQLEDRKQIDRAKAILIKVKNLSEDEAYHTLRKLAMGRNMSLGEMARNVIAMADLLK